jgi:DNA-binding HxlR family transcriptional regulator
MKSVAGKKRVPKPGAPVRGSRTGRPVMALLDLLGRRWALRVIWELREGRVLNFRELAAACGVSPGVLASRLADLRESRIVTHAGQGYALTPIGRELLDRLMPLHEWAEEWAGGTEVGRRGKVA